MYAERARWGLWDRSAALVPQAYVDAVVQTGGVPLLLPPQPCGERDALAAVDGLVIAGGPDLDPGAYGARPHAQTRTTRPDRDSWEIRLLRVALDEDLPVLGICRGAQVLNVALGGTLHQHLPDTVGHGGHRPEPAVFGSSLVRFTADSRIASILGDKTEVACYHHQAIDRLGVGLHAVGWAADGTVETVELAGAAFCLGVQWHPEEDADDMRLFAALAAAAGRVRSTVEGRRQ